MANLIFTIFMFFFIIPVSYARLRLQILPENAFSSVAVVPDSEVDPIIRLPSDESESESESQLDGTNTPLAIGIHEVDEKLLEKEIGDNEIGEKLAGKEIGRNEIGEKLLPEKKIGSNKLVEKEIGNKEFNEKLLEKEIVNNKLAEKQMEKEIRTEEVVENLPGKEIRTRKVVENLPEKVIGNNEIVEKLPEDELLFNDFAELLDMMLPEMKTGDNEVAAEKLPETETSEIDDKSSETETETGTVKSIPLRIAKFHPVNRHLRFRWRRSPRPCHHLHHRHHHHLFPYSKDMLIPTGENSDINPVIIHRHRFHRIPSRSISLPYPYNYHHHLHHNHNDEDHDNKDEESKSVFKRSARFSKEKFKKHFHHDDHEDEDKEEEKSNRFKGDVKIHKQHDHKENGLLQRIRKMLIF